MLIDTITLIPFLKDMENHLTFKYKNIVADAGYDHFAENINWRPALEHA